jgi:hypothetical protein
VGLVLLIAKGRNFKMAKITKSNECVYLLHNRNKIGIIRLVHLIL